MRLQHLSIDVSGNDYVSGASSALHTNGNTTNINLGVKTVSNRSKSIDPNAKQMAIHLSSKKSKQKLKRKIKPTEEID